MKLKHIKDTNMSNTTTKELRTLVHAGTNQSASVGPTGDGKEGRDGGLGGDEVLGSGAKVVKDVLLVALDAGVVPLLAILATAADVGDGEDTPEVLHEEELAGGEGGL